MLHWRWEPDTLVVPLKNLLARDLLSGGHPGVLRLGGARVVPAVVVRRRDQARDRQPAARTGREGRVLETLTRLIDYAARRTFVFVDGDRILRERGRARRTYAGQQSPRVRGRHGAVA